jgi:chromosome segregation ATPase
MKRSTLSLSPLILCRAQPSAKAQSFRKAEGKQAEKLVSKILGEDLASLPKGVDVGRFVDAAFQHANQTLIQTFTDPTARPAVSAVVLVPRGESELFIAGTGGYRIIAVSEAEARLLFPLDSPSDSSGRPRARLLGIDAAVKTHLLPASVANYHSLVTVPMELQAAWQSLKGSPQGLDRRLQDLIGSESVASSQLINLSGEAVPATASGRRKMVLAGMTVSVGVFAAMVGSHLLAPKSRPSTQLVLGEEMSLLADNSFTHIEELPVDAVDLAEHTKDIGTIIQTLEKMSEREDLMQQPEGTPGREAMLIELNHQLEHQLSDQKRLIKTYQEEIDTLQVEHASTSNLKEELERIRAESGDDAEKEALLSRAVLLEEMLQARENSVAKLREELDRQAESLQARDETHRQLITQLDSLCGEERARASHLEEIASLTERLTSADTEVANLRSDVDAAQLQLGENEEAMLSHVVQINELANQLSTSRTGLFETEQELAALKGEKVRLDQLEEEYIGFLDEYHSLKERSSNMESRMEEERTVAQQMSDALVLLQEQHATLQTRCDQLALECEAKDEGFATASTNFDLVEKAMTELETRCATLAQELSEAQERGQDRDALQEALVQTEEQRTTLQADLRAAREGHEALLADLDNAGELATENLRVAEALKELQARHVALQEDFDAQSQKAMLADEVAPLQERIAEMSASYATLEQAHADLVGVEDERLTLLEDEEQRRKVFQTAIGELQMKLQVSQTEMEELAVAHNVELQERDAAFARAEQERERIESMLSLLQAERSELEQSHAQLQAHASQLEQEVEQHGSAVVAAECDNRLLRAAYEQKVASLEELSAELKASGLASEERAAESRTHAAELQDALAIESEGHGKLQAQYGEMEENFKELQGKFITTTVRVEEAEQRLAMKKDENKDVMDQLVALTADHTALRDSYDHLTKREGELVKIVDSLREVEQALAVEEEKAIGLEQELSERAVLVASREEALAQHQKIEESLKGRLGEMTTAYEDAEQRLRELNHVLSRSTQEVEAFETRLAQVSSMNEEKDTLIHSAESAAEQLAGRVNDLQEVRQSLELEKAELAHHVDRLRHFEEDFAREHQLRMQKDELLTTLASTVQEQKAALNASELSRAAFAAEVERLRGMNNLPTGETYQASTTPKKPAPSRATVTRVHLVAPGETLDAIAQRYHRNADEIYQANREVIPGQSAVPEGTALIIP